MGEIAVVVTCHSGHLKWLPEALASIDRQAPAAAERIVVFDRCSPPSISPHWRVIRGDWGHPSPGRDAGMQSAASPWIIFWDADNVMPDGYIGAMQQASDRAPTDVAILYPDIQYCDEQLRPQRLWRTPEWDYWEMRGENCVDTSSAWRKEAVELIGGWSAFPCRTFEDYALALNLTGSGWRAAKVNAPPIQMRVHSGSRTQSREQEGRTLHDLWQVRSLAIVTLLAGREAVFERWMQFLRNAELPPKTALYVVDNSRQPAFNRVAYEACQQIAAARGLTHLDFTVSGQAYPAGNAQPDGVRKRHLHVASLYTRLLPRIPEDLILTLEDDVEPPLDAVRKLVEEVGWTNRGKIGAVAGAYAMAEHPALVCAGNGVDQWGPAIPWSQLPHGAMDVGCVGGGCTVWANWALQRRPINFWWHQYLGWDAALSIQIRRRGFRVRLHGGVRCQHHAHGSVRFTPGIRFEQRINRMSEGRKMAPADGQVNFWLLALSNRALAPVNGAGLRQNADSWIPLGELGTRIPPYRPTYPFAAYINPRHEALAACAVDPQGTVALGIPGWLRQEDALKLYELAGYARGDILELGCFQGLSTAIMAQALRDTGGGRTITSIDYVANHTRLAQRQLESRGLAEEVTFRVGDGSEVCRKLVAENRRFSFVFIDHSHQYEDVARICRLLPDLLAGDGFALFHDYNDGRNADPRNHNYGVPQAVTENLKPDRFAFFGIFGCTALYRMCP